MIHRSVKIIASPSGVVNCFQNCILRDDSQAKQYQKTISNGCELLSKLYLKRWFTGFFATSKTFVCCELLSKLYLKRWFTGGISNDIDCRPLWIAFKIVS